VDDGREDDVVVERGKNASMPGSTTYPTLDVIVLQRTRRRRSGVVVSPAQQRHSARRRHRRRRPRIRSRDRRDVTTHDDERQSASCTMESMTVSFEGRRHHLRPFVCN